MNSRIENREIDADTKIDIKFSELGLDDRILRALDDLGTKNQRQYRQKQFQLL